MVKKVLWFVFFCVFLVTSIILSVVVVNKNKQMDSMYTQEQYDNVYEDAAENERKLVLKIETLTAEIDTKDSTIASLQNDVSTHLSSIEKLENDVLVLTQEKANLEAENASLQEDLDSSEESNAEKDAQIAENNAKIAELESEIADKNATIEDLNNEITDFEAQIVSLNNEVTRLTAELEAYKDMELTGFNKLEFLNGTEVISTIYVENGDSIPYVPTVENTQESWFYGWTTVEGSSDLVDFTNFVPSEDVTYYAVTGECVNLAMFNSKGSDLSKQNIRVGADVTLAELFNFTHGLDITSENVELVYHDSTAYVAPDMTMKVTELPTGELTHGQLEDGTAAVVNGYVLNYRLRYLYNYSALASCLPSFGYSIEVPDYLVDYTSISSFNASVYLDVDGTQTQALDVSLTYGSVKTYTFDNGMSVDFSITPKTSSCSVNFVVYMTQEDGSVVEYSDANVCFTDVSCKLSLSEFYVATIDFAENIDFDLYWEAEEVPIVYSSVFAENDAATIAAVSEEIAENNMTSEEVYNTYGWSVGDTHDITLTNGEVIQVMIIGFNHDDKSDGTGKAGLTLQMVDCLATTYSMNSTNTNAGGYAASVMKTSTLPTIKALLPQEWQDAIKLVDKKSANGGSTNYIETLTLSEDLFLFAEIEIFGTSSYAEDGANEGSVYEYWNGKAAADRIKKYDTDADGVADIASNWWLRSAMASSGSSFCGVGPTGNISYSGAKSSRNVSFGFCI